MSGSVRPSFNTRSFVSLLLAASALGLVPTGVADHVTQSASASVAHHGWVLAHVACAVLFVVSAAWHVTLNRRALLKRLRGTGRIFPISREAAAAGALIAIPLLLLVGHAVAGG